MSVLTTPGGEDLAGRRRRRCTNDYFGQVPEEGPEEEYSSLNLGGRILRPVLDIGVPALAIQDNGRFTWTASGQGKTPMMIAGASTFADGVLTLVDQGGQNVTLAGKVMWQDADHVNFRLAGAPPTGPGLSFSK